MSKSRVAVIRCDTYAEDQVLRAVREGLDLLGGVSVFARTGEKIVLKPNIVVGTSPDKCVTTHPSVLRAIGTLLKEAGVTVLYGDGPSFGKSETHLKWAGLKQVGDELGLTLADFDSGRSVSHKDALLVKRFTVANGALDCDGLVSLPKLKTHGLVRFTGAVKNQFGCVPGLMKSQHHMKLPDPYDFATMLVDINTLVRPRLYLMDGIIAMEGNGPRTGKPKPLKVLLLSSDPVALDAVACRIINLSPDVVPTFKPGEKAGLGTYHMEDIETIGEDVKSFVDRDFDVVRTPPMPVRAGVFRTLLKNRITEKPVINEAACTRCGTCVMMCPVKPRALDWRNGDKSRPPTYDYDHCIRCYCCQETCPEGAIMIQRPLLGRLVSRI